MEKTDASDEQIIIRSSEDPRAGWDEAFREMHARGDDELLDGDHGTSSWDDEEWVWDRSPDGDAASLSAGVTTIVERDGDWFIARCQEIPGANGQGRTKDECLANLGHAIALILEDHRDADG